MIYINEQHVTTSMFIESVRNKKIIVLGIPNNHYFMEPDLIKMINKKVDPYLGI